MVYVRKWQRGIISSVGASALLLSLWNAVLDAAGDLVWVLQEEGLHPSALSSTATRTRGGAGAAVWPPICTLREDKQQGFTDRFWRPRSMKKGRERTKHSFLGKDLDLT